MGIVVTDEAAGVLLDVLGFRRNPKGWFPDEIRKAKTAIQAALPYLTDAEEPLVALPPTLSTADVEALGRAGMAAFSERFDRLERLLHDQWAHRFDTAGEPDPHEVRAEALRSAARALAPMTQSGAQNVIAIAKRFQAYIQDGV